jgi:hypothetical protein
MTLQHALNWALAGLMAGILATSHLLDGPDDIQLAADTAGALADAQAQAKAQAQALARAQLYNTRMASALGQGQVQQ